MASIHQLPTAPFEPRPSTIYSVASVLCFLDTMQWPAGFGVVPDVDLEAVLGDLVTPRLPPNNRFHATLKSWTQWEALSYSVYRRGVQSHAGVMLPKYFVGMVVSSCSNDFAAAFIIDWMVSPPIDADAISK